jgi:hypothetical protein
VIAGDFSFPMTKSDLASARSRHVDKTVWNPNIEFNLNEKTMGFDPLKVLPPEIFAYIFQLVPFRTLVKCLEISHDWNYFLTGTPSIWSSSIDFGDASFGSVPVAAIRKYISYSLAYSCLSTTIIKHISVCQIIEKQEKDCVEFLGLACNHKIQSLDITLCDRKFNPDGNSTALFREMLVSRQAFQGLRSLSFNIDHIRFDCLVQILTVMPQLEDLGCHVGYYFGVQASMEIPPLPLLKTLSLSGAIPHDNPTDGSSAMSSFFSDLVGNAPNLEQLQFNVRNAGRGVIRVIESLDRLRKLLLGCDSHSELPQLSCENLEELSLIFFVLRRPQNVNQVKLTHLRSLDITWIECHGCQQLYDFYGFGPELESLMLYGSGTALLEDIESICKEAPHLKKLSVPFSDMTVADVQRIVNQYCSDIDEIDICGTMLSQTDFETLLLSTKIRKVHYDDTLLERDELELLAHRGLKLLSPLCTVFGYSSKKRMDIDPMLLLLESPMTQGMPRQQSALISCRLSLPHLAPRLLAV